MLAGRQVPNPVVLITKCLIPDDAIGAVTTARRAGLRVIVYVSYSGLGRAIERGIRHDDLKTNFPRLAQAGAGRLEGAFPGGEGSRGARSCPRIAPH